MGLLTSHCYAMRVVIVDAISDGLLDGWSSKNYTDCEEGWYLGAL